MNKWTVRVVGILLLLFLMFILFDLQRKLVLMQQQTVPAQKK